MTLNRRLSSAKSFACEDFIDSGRSLMKHRNNRGPRTVPRGIPDRTSAVSDLTHLAKEGFYPAFDIAPYSVVVQLVKESCVRDFFKRFGEI